MWDRCGEHQQYPERKETIHPKERTYKIPQRGKYFDIHICISFNLDAGNSFRALSVDYILITVKIAQTGRRF